MKTIKIPFRSYILIAVQLSALGYLIIPELLHQPDSCFLLGFVPSFLLVFWAVVMMKRSHLSVFPDLPGKARLITAGPYRYIRHPMYSSLVILTLPIVIRDHTWDKILAGTMLYIVIYIKIKIEESQLGQRFSGYDRHKKRTGAIFPNFF